MDYRLLPYPLSRLYQEYLAEKNPGLKLRALIKAFSGFLKFITLIVISDYLEHHALEDHSDDHVKAQVGMNRFKF